MVLPLFPFFFSWSPFFFFFSFLWYPTHQDVKRCFFFSPLPLLPPRVWNFSFFFFFPPYLGDVEGREEPSLFFSSFLQPSQVLLFPSSKREFFLLSLPLFARGNFPFFLARAKRRSHRRKETPSFPFLPFFIR